MLVAPLLAAVAVAGPPVHLTIADSGGLIRVPRATRVVVTLPSNASTGFRWKLLAPLDRRIVRLVGHRYVASSSGLVGAPGKEIWRFRTVGAGSAVLRLGYLRSWEPQHLERRFRVTLRVR